MDHKVYRQKLASSGQTGDQWQREADNWFDGTVESVDRRLAMCNLLLARSEERYARNMGARHDLKAIIDLQDSQRHLRALREDLLTASENKTAAPLGAPAPAAPPPAPAAPPVAGGAPAPAFSPPEPPSHINESFKEPWRNDVANGLNPFDPGSQVHGLIHGSHTDRRWVALEGARFYRANDDVNDSELLIRAKHHAELQTSTRSVTDSRAITSAFVQKVAALAESDPGRLHKVHMREWVANGVDFDGPGSVTTSTKMVASAGPDEALFM